MELEEIKKMGDEYIAKQEAKNLNALEIYDLIFKSSVNLAEKLMGQVTPTGIPEKLETNLKVANYMLQTYNNKIKKLNLSIIS